MRLALALALLLLAGSVALVPTASALPVPFRCTPDAGLIAGQGVGAIVECAGRTCFVPAPGTLACTDILCQEVVGSQLQPRGIFDTLFCRDVTAACTGAGTAASACVTQSCSCRWW